MNINQFRENLEQFIGTLSYHRLNLYPVYATDGVEYFCRTVKAFWLFDDMSAVAMKNKDEEFIVVKIRSGNNKCDVIYDDGNGKKIYHQYYSYTDLPEGDWKFYISNYPTEKVIMLPSEY